MPRGHKLNPQPKAKSDSGIPASAGHRRWARGLLLALCLGAAGLCEAGGQLGQRALPLRILPPLPPSPGAGGRARAAGSSLGLAEGLRSSAAPGRGTRRWLGAFSSLRFFFFPPG